MSKAFVSVEDQGISNLAAVHYNLSEPALLEFAIQRKEGSLGLGGTLLVETGKYTGRSPNDKFVVETADVKDKIWWENNAPMTPEAFEKLASDMRAYMQGGEYFVQDLFCGAEKSTRLKIRVISELAWHGLFSYHLLRRPSADELTKFVPDFTIINCPDFKPQPKRHGCRSDVVIALNFDKKEILIAGTKYAGENKKSVFSLMNYLLPEHGIMTMHCAANHECHHPEESAIFFGLSGTGKTTLSTDPERVLIGDDEHGWYQEGVFNMEGGCYAKTLNLSPATEPEIFATTKKFATVIENVKFNPLTRVIDFSDDSITTNMRCAYPLDYIKNSSKTGMGGHPRHIVMLTCDAFGVLPPIARLSPAQAMYHFLCGFTSKVAGTERGIKEPEPTFSACFGAPFMLRRPEVYGNLLRKKIAEHNVSCWLVNTGWSQGGYGNGKRIPIAITRMLLYAALHGELNDVEMRRDPFFGFEVPLSVKGDATSYLDPCSTWKNPKHYNKTAKKLVSMFAENFKAYADFVDDEVKKVAL